MTELKALPNTLNLLLILVIVAVVFNRTGRKKAYRIVLVLTIVLFLIASTPFVPRYLLSRLENGYPTFRLKNFSNDVTGLVFVHVLGAGYSLDPDLPPNGQLQLVTLGRLIEGMRICQQIPESILVCSGYSSLGLESQASVARRAAISLGFDSTRIGMLTSPSTTEEEANALADRYGTQGNVIIVTDAIHMPRAMRIFTNAGFRPFPAPTNFINKSAQRRGLLSWLPSIRNIELTDRLLHEFMGEAKFFLEHDAS